MKFEQFYYDPTWLEKAREENFMATDTGLRVYRLKIKGRTIDLAGGEPIDRDRFNDLAGTLAAPGREIEEYFRYFRGTNPLRPERAYVLVARYRVDGIPMTMREKVRMLREATPEDVERIRSIVTDGTVSVEGGRVVVRKDLRAIINAAMHRDKVTRKSVAELTGKSLQNLGKYLNGHTGIPYDTLEELLWLAEDGNAHTNGSED